MPVGICYRTACNYPSATGLQGFIRGFYGSSSASSVATLAANLVETLRSDVFGPRLHEDSPPISS